MKQSKRVGCSIVGPEVTSYINSYQSHTQVLQKMNPKTKKQNSCLKQIQYKPMITRKVCGVKQDASQAIE